MIEFIECPYIGYAERTRQNVRETDVTIAFAVDFTTAGEKCTFNACNAYSRLYIPVNFNDLVCPDPIVHTTAIGRVQHELDNVIYHQMTLNIAGNGLHALRNRGQQFVDDTILYALQFLNREKIGSIRSGGQSGVDEAALKAADKLGIRAKCVAPKGWIYRDINGKDIKGEESFKARFKT